MSLGAILCASLLLGAAQQVALQQAIDLYWNGEYERTLQLLGSELDANEVVEGHKYRAFSLVALERNDEAMAEFGALLEADPGHTLDAALVSPKIVEVFEQARTKLSASLFERGKTAYFDGRYDEAFETLQKLMKLDPSSTLGAEYLQLARERIDIEKQTADLEPAAPPEVDPDRIYNVGGDVTEPVVTSQEPPRYPQWDMRNGTEGEVILRLTVGRGGAVENSEIVRSVNARMDAEAQRATRNWRYQPARLAGQPVRCYKVVAIRFALRR